MAKINLTFFGGTLCVLALGVLKRVKFSDELGKNQIGCLVEELL
jgi:hypothetical protein